MKELNQDIKTGKFKSLYLFYGGESYLKGHYTKMIADKANGGDLFNSEEFEGKAAPVGKIYDAALTLPFMADYRVITVKNSGLFAPGRKSDSEFMAGALSDIPETTILLFVETDVDKRSALFKLADKAGKALEFKTPDEAELTKWVMNVFNKYNVRIDKPTAAYLLRTVQGGMGLLQNEIQKLASAAQGEVTTADIDAVCVKSLDSRIFELVGAIGEKRLDKALTVYGNLMLIKESPIMVLSMIARQMRIILQVKEMKGRPPADIARETGIAPFAVSSALKQSVNFTKEDLIGAIRHCLKTDRAVKTGAMGDKIGVEMLIIEFCSK